MSLMADDSSDYQRASRKAEEAALRRYQAVGWLESVVGPLGIPAHPTETDFVSCLRNGIILCNLINFIQPATISKVVDNHVPVDSELAIWDSRPLPAYQYFENVRNFLLAVDDLKLPAFEASDLERENLEAGSAGRIADCILALKSYHERKDWSGENREYKHATTKSPLVLHSAPKNFSQLLNKEPCRRLDMSSVDNRQSLTDSIAKVLSEHMVESKENMNINIQCSVQKGSQDPVQIFSDILSRCLEEKLRIKFPVLNLQETSGKASHPQPKWILQENLSVRSYSEIPEAQPRKSSSDLRRILKSQEKNLTDIKALWSGTKKEFDALHNQLMNDLNQLGGLVEEMYNPAHGYHKVIQENKKLYNMVQDLKGNIRVHCRIRPVVNAEARNVISSQGEDGTLAVLDPSKPPAEGRKLYRFNRVYGPTATQDELFKDAQPLIRSVMDGYNVCIFAYGQTGSGKSHTMYGPSGVYEKVMGINFFAINDLFSIVNSRKDIVNYKLQLQIVEICDEQIRDLLPEVSASKDELNITSHAVKSNTEAIDLVKHGEVRRTGDNCSHSVVTVHVQGEDLSGNIRQSRLHLVDLAGNEGGDKSLACLEDAIKSLSQKHSCIQYIDSKLTSLLQEALGGKTKILVFAHVIPEGPSFTNTVSTLTFAQKISTLDVKAAYSNKMNSEVMELKNEIEILKNALGNKTASSLRSTKQLKSPCDKPRVVPQKTPVKSRRLSMENQGKPSKSPVGRPKITPETPKHSLRTSVENPSGRKADIVRNTGIGKQLEGSLPRYRRLSIENPMIVTSEKIHKLQEPKSPYEGKKGVIRPTPPRKRRSSIENSNSVKLNTDNEKGTKAPPSSLHVRRLSLEGPKDRKNATLKDPKAPSPSYLNEPTFTDCADKFPSLQPPKTPEQQFDNQQHMIHSGASILTDFQTPEIAKSTNSKTSQIKKSLRTIGKLINGSDKRSQHKVESTSMKVKEVVNGAKSPSSPKARVVRRQSLTNLPLSGTTRRTSLGGTSTDARPNNNRNAGNTSISTAINQHKQQSVVCSLPFGT